MTAEKLTPMMQQYKRLKDKHKECVLFFRLGDFYELFFEDAVEISRVLNLTLTKRHTTPMCGVPYHAVEGYIGRLTKLGKKVAICDQLSDPSLPGIVERDVVRIITPGTTFDERILEQKSNRYIISIVIEGERSGLAVCDVTTGLFNVSSFENEGDLKEEVGRLSPAECIIDAGEKNLPQFLKQFEKMPVFPHQLWDEPREYLSKHYGVKDLKGFGFDHDSVLVRSAALLLSYLKETQKSDLAHLQAPKLVSKIDEMIVDETAVSNLELLKTLREGAKEGSLLSIIDATQTSMGGRTLRHWLLHPLHTMGAIEERQGAVSELMKSNEARLKLPDILKNILDLERLLAKISVGTGNARDILGIALSLKNIEPTLEVLKDAKSPLLAKLNKELKEITTLILLRETLLKTIVENPPLSVKDGGLVASGVNEKLDELRGISSEGKGFIQKLQQSEIERTGINSLKVRFNSVFGYYIEITKTNLSLVPENYIRKQTLVNAERFITPELKEYEEKVLGAEEKIKELEYQIFLEMRALVKAHTRDIQKAAQIFGQLDALLSLAIIAEKFHYTKPQIGQEGSELAITNGRHPVVEVLSPGTFVPNTTELNEDGRIILLSGPNMGGKSTYLRQTALIVLLAHIGSFVPADNAKIPLTDRIFTRVGASDNLVRGQSTFMVEMQEAAHILHYATKHSLIILDEIGRGTSTYDGVSLAWAILEYIHNSVGAKTLFATHYHELINVANRLPHAKNFSVAVKEEKDSIVFLYRIKEGAINKSYGIEVAKLAGLPKEVIATAKTILSDLEEGVLDSAIEKKARSSIRNDQQIGMFESSDRPHRVIEELKKVDVNELTPVEALKKLDEWKKMDL